MEFIGRRCSQTSYSYSGTVLVIDVFNGRNRCQDWNCEPEALADYLGCELVVESTVSASASGSLFYTVATVREPALSPVRSFQTFSIISAPTRPYSLGRGGMIDVSTAS